MKGPDTRTTELGPCVCLRARECVHLCVPYGQLDTTMKEINGSGK